MHGVKRRVCLIQIFFFAIKPWSLQNTLYMFYLYIPLTHDIMSNKILLCLIYYTLCSCVRSSRVRRRSSSFRQCSHTFRRSGTAHLATSEPYTRHGLPKRMLNLSDFNKKYWLPSHSKRFCSYMYFGTLLFTEFLKPPQAHTIVDMQICSGL